MATPRFSSPRHPFSSSESHSSISIIPLIILETMVTLGKLVLLDLFDYVMHMDSFTHRISAFICVKTNGTQAMLEAMKMEQKKMSWLCYHCLEERDDSHISFEVL